MQPCNSRADQARHNIPFAGVLWLLAPTSWHCHHKCPAAFGLHASISLINTAETKPGQGAITAVVYLPSPFVFVEQVWSYLRQESQDMDVLSKMVCVCACRHMDAPVQEDGRGQRVLYLSAASYLKLKP